jgi:hypothetical protein
MWTLSSRIIPGQGALRLSRHGSSQDIHRWIRAEALSTRELCLAWRRSYLTLLDLPPGPARWEIARIRQCLLDELERRDRDGFTRWLDAGARASSDPGRYLSDQ